MAVRYALQLRKRPLNLLMVNGSLPRKGLLASKGDSRRFTHGPVVRQIDGKWARREGQTPSTRWSPHACLPESAFSRCY